MRLAFRVGRSRATPCALALAPTCFGAALVLVLGAGGTTAGSPALAATAPGRGAWRGAGSCGRLIEAMAWMEERERVEAFLVAPELGSE